MKLLIPVLIYVAVPGVGLWAFFYLKEFIRQRQRPSLPDIPLLLVFACYGGWLLVLLTGLFWYWSGMAFLGTILLVFGAPIVLGYFAWRLRSQRQLSPYHFRLFLACACYPILPAVLLLAVIWFG